MTAPYTELDVADALDAGAISEAEARERLVHLDQMKAGGTTIHNPTFVRAPTFALPAPQVAEATRARGPAMRPVPQIGAQILRPPVENEGYRRTQEPTREQKNFANAVYGPFTELSQGNGIVAGGLRFLQSPTGTPNSIKRQAMDYAREMHGGTQTAAAQLLAFAPDYVAAGAVAPALMAAAPASAIPGVLARPLLQAAQFGAYEGMAGAAQGNTLPQVNERMAQGAAGGLLFGAGGEVASRGLAAVGRGLEAGRALHADAQAALLNPPRNPGEFPVETPRVPGAPERPEGYQPLPLDFKPRPVAPPLTDAEIPTFIKSELAPSAGVEMHSANPGVFVDQALKAVGDTRVADAVRRDLAPQMRSPEARQAALTLRANLGREALANARETDAVGVFRGMLGKLPEDQQLALSHRMEAGQRQPTPELQAVADHLRSAYDRVRDEVRALGTGKLEDAIDNYVAHIWANPADKEGVIAGLFTRRPLAGRKSFLKQRSWGTIQEGLDNIKNAQSRLGTPLEQEGDKWIAGLQPVTTNPVDLMLLKTREMQKYLMAHRTFAELQDAGLVRLVRSLDESKQAQLDGMARINDPIATVFGPREGAVVLPKGANIRPKDVTVLGRRVMGEYWAPEPVARVLNNHLSPGLRQNELYNLYQTIGNTLNQAQLGLSAFHLGFTSVDAAVSRAALGLRQLRGGDVGRSLVTMLRVADAPFTNIVKGNRLLVAALRGTKDPRLARLVTALEQAGGRIRMDSFYHTYAGKQLAEMFRTGKGWKPFAARAGIGAGVGAFVGDENRPKGALLGAMAGAFGPALLDVAAKPIMEYVVPRQKLGVFADLADYELSKLPAGTALTDPAARDVLARVWDSVDNRMGQLVYDNLFWNRTFKDLTLATVRSVGWNLGTIRELGGGVLDLARGRMTSRTDYLFALPVTVGLLGAVTQYLYTGKGPETLRDYFYPQTGKMDADGNPDRLELPSYVKDIAAYSRHPVQTLQHKVHPAVQLVVDMLTNRDYFGDRIRNEDDPIIRQAKQSADYIINQFVPFGIRNTQEIARREGGLNASSVAPFFGAIPAPRWAVRTEGQNVMAEALGRNRTEGTTPDARKRSDVLRNVRAFVDSGRPYPKEKVAEGLRTGLLTVNDVTETLNRKPEIPLVRRFKMLSLADAARAYAKGNARERALWAPILGAKFDRADPEEQQRAAAFLSSTRRQ